MRLLIIGDGKMGQALGERAVARGHQVAGMLGAGENASGSGVKAFAGKADVAIEFTEPHAAADNIRACVGAGLPVVVGTTGWYDSRPGIENFVRGGGGTVLIAPNFSVGVAIMTEIARKAGELFSGYPDFDATIVETHHNQKKDAPSGTAAALGDGVGETLGRRVPITSVRVGSAPGTHTLVFDGPFEQIVIQHEARDRRVFADGAVRAAEWLLGKQGVFTMRDLTRAIQP
jgi:4-hydroxy-tetrahydrodipicolinate reductase